MKRIIHNPVLKDTVTFLQTSAGSGGAITEVEVEVMPGGGNPAHFHKTYDETFTVVEGILRVRVSGRTPFDLLPGQSCLVKTGQAHRFQNLTDAPARVRATISPGCPGFENSLRILYGLASDGLYNAHQRPRQVQHLAVCATMGDTRLPGLLSVLNPVLRVVARFARWRGIEMHLCQRYCV